MHKHTTLLYLVNIIRACFRVLLKYNKIMYWLLTIGETYKYYIIIIVFSWHKLSLIGNHFLPPLQKNQFLIFDILFSVNGILESVNRKFVE